MKKGHLEECHLLPSTFPTRPALFIYIHSNSNYSTNITYNDKNNYANNNNSGYDLEGASSIPPDSFDRVGLVVAKYQPCTCTVHSHLMRMKMLQQAAFVLIFVAAAWGHQYFPGAGSIIRARIVAAGWVHQYLPEDGGTIGTQQSTENT